MLPWQRHLNLRRLDIRNDLLSRVLVAPTGLRFRAKFDVDNPPFVFRANLSSVFLVIQGGKRELVSWVGEAGLNECKLEKVKNHHGVPKTATDEINENILINRLFVIRAKSAVTIYQIFTFDEAGLASVDVRGGWERMDCYLDVLRCLTSYIKREDSIA